MNANKLSKVLNCNLELNISKHHRPPPSIDETKTIIQTTQADCHAISFNLQSQTFPQAKQASQRTTAVALV